MKVEVIRKTVYGKELIYPVTFSKELEWLTHKKTLDFRDINVLRTLGVEIVVKQEEI